MANVSDKKLLNLAKYLGKTNRIGRGAVLGLATKVTASLGLTIVSFSE